LEQRARRSFSGGAAQWQCGGRGFFSGVDNQVAKVDVAVVGNNSDAALEAEATMEVEVILEAEAAEVTLVVLDGWPCWTLKSTHKKMRNAKFGCYLRHGKRRNDWLELHQVHAGDYFYWKTLRNVLSLL
jgi:hypothetical protein